jgi:8-oxo-dGTP diphosphatase
MMHKSMHDVVINCVIFRIHNDALEVYAPGGVLPSVTLEASSSIEEEAHTVVRKLGEKEYYREQLYTFYEKKCVVVSYFILIPTSTVSNSSFISINKSLNNPFDKKVVSYARQRLQWKIEYTNVVYSLLPYAFTLSEMQKVYEAILGRSLDKRNFRKKIFSLKILQDTGKKKRLGQARPAEIYEFKDHKLVTVEIL